MYSNRYKIDVLVAWIFLGLPDKKCQRSQVSSAAHLQNSSRWGLIIRESKTRTDYLCSMKDEKDEPKWFHLPCLLSVTKTAQKGSDSDIITLYRERWMILIYLHWHFKWHPVKIALRIRVEAAWNSSYANSYYFMKSSIRILSLQKMTWMCGNANGRPHATAWGRAYP